MKLENKLMFIGILMSCFISCDLHESSVEKKKGNFEWGKSVPETHGISANKLESARLLLEEKGTNALLVIRNDRIVLEWYARGWHKSKKHYTASLAKSLAGGMILLVAINDERLALDDLAADYIPQWKNDNLKSKITIKMLATHSSGIEDATQDGIDLNKLSGWKGQFWKDNYNPFIIARDQAPVTFQPGTQYAYSGPGFAMLGYAVSASLSGTPQSDVYQTLKDRIMDPIGVSDNEWVISYNTAYEADGLRLYAIWGGGAYTARAVAKVGRLMLRKGNWEGKQLIKPGLVEKMVSYAVTPLPNRLKDRSQPGSAICWWSNFDNVWSSLPRDAFVGAGAGHEVLLVVPSLDLIVVRFGDSLSVNKDFHGNLKKYDVDSVSGKEGQMESFWEASERYIFDPLMESIGR